MSTITNPRSEINDNQNPQPSESNINESTGVHASTNVNLDSDQHEHPLRASDMSELRNPAKPFSQNRLNLDETIVSDEDFEDEHYHTNFAQLSFKTHDTTPVVRYKVVNMFTLSFSTFKCINERTPDKNSGPIFK